MNENVHFTDNDILDKYRRCHTKPFGLLIERYNDYIYKIFRYKSISKEDAEDLSQDLWFSFTRNLKVIQLNKSFRAYLNQAISNKVKDYIRKKTAKGRFNIKLKEIINTIVETDILDHVIQRDVLKCIDDYLDDIRKEEQKLSIAYWLENMSYKTIAKEVGIPIGTVSAYIHRSKKAIRQSLQNGLGDSP